MIENTFNISLTGLGVMAGMMFLVWLIHIPLKNAGIVDVAWAFGLALLAAVYAALGDGDILRKWIFAAMVIVWGLRLTVHLFVRVVGHAEDGRYAQMRKEWGGNISLKFLVFFQFQALLNVFLAIPFLLVSVNTNSDLSFFEFAGMTIWAVALIGESAADQQLPNYFFEWLIWVSFFVFALGSPYGWASAVCPALMLYFLYRVTGIPATEAQALRTKGDDYREYQRTTSAFVPWFKKN